MSKRGYRVTLISMPLLVSPPRPNYHALYSLTLYKLWADDGVEPFPSLIKEGPPFHTSRVCLPTSVSKCSNSHKSLAVSKRGSYPSWSGKCAEWVGLEPPISCPGFSPGMPATKPATIILHTQTCFTMQRKSKVVSKRGTTSQKYLK